MFQVLSLVFFFVIGPRYLSNLTKMPPSSSSSLHYTNTPMPPPERLLQETHAIKGLLGRGIQSYEVYKGEQGVKAIVKLGLAVDGHMGVVHGGILALLIDDVLGFAYEALDIPLAVTANLNINYRAAVPADSEITILTTLVERKERKLSWEVQVLSANGLLHCEATSIYVIPRDVYETMTTTTPTTTIE
jgi:uncharacterized protein (TIGR00369 family)